VTRKPPQWRAQQDARIQWQGVYGGGRDINAGKSDTLCNRCGDCCEVIHASVGIPDLHAMMANPYIVGVVRRQAEILLDMLEERIDVSHGRVGYSCRHFDRETRLCGIHDRRPDMCRGYPFYGGDPTPDAYMSQRCSFQADFRKQLPIVEVR
jgi:Fe-S-cluster containining protein